VLRATGNAIGFNADQLKRMAEEGQRATAFQDDAIQRAQTMLLTFDHINKDTFPKAIQSAMDLATLMGGDLAAAAQAVGQALQQPETAGRRLRAMNVVLTESQQEQLKVWVETGHEAKAQAFILEQLERRYGGLAKSSVTATQSLKSATGELMEGLGSAFLGVMEAGAAAILKVKKAMDAGNEFSGMAMVGPDVIRQIQQQKKVMEEAQRLQEQERGRFHGPTAAQQDHIDRLLKAEKEAREKAAKEAREAEEADAIAARDFKVQQFHNEQEQLRRIRAAATRERDEALRADEEKTRQIYEARQRVLEAQAGGDDMKLLEAKQQHELQALAMNEAAKTELIKAHELERETLRKKISDQKAQDEVQAQMKALAAAQKFANAYSHLMDSLGAKNKALAKAGAMVSKIAALISIKTGMAKAYEQGGMYGFIGAAAVAMEGAAIIADISASIGKFRTGTLNAQGGMALVGEDGPELMEVPRGARIYNNTETRQMFNGGSVTVGEIRVEVSGAGRPEETARAVGDALMLRLRTLKSDLRRLDYMNVPDDL
jgi:hypothetical protein